MKVGNLAVGVLLLLASSGAGAETRRDVKARRDVSHLCTALQMFKLDTFRYPTTEEGLSALVTAPPELQAAGTWRGYLPHVPRDPWGNEYQYLSPGRNNPTDFDLWSNGADGKVGGDGPDADIGNWPEASDACTIRNSNIDELRNVLIFGTPFGFMVGLPLYVAGYIRERRRGSPTPHLGFHLAALIYLTMLFPALGMFMAVVVW
jgi:type II secretion system protein G